MTIAMYCRTSWREVEENFTVGQMDGEFAGTIERRADRFTATTGTGTELGEFRSAAAAERALERAAEQANGRPPQTARGARESMINSTVLLAGILATGTAAVLALVSL